MKKLFRKRPICPKCGINKGHSHGVLWCDECWDKYIIQPQIEKEKRKFTITEEEIKKFQFTAYQMAVMKKLLEKYHKIFDPNSEKKFDSKRDFRELYERYVFLFQIVDYIDIFFYKKITNDDVLLFRIGETLKYKGD